MVVQDDLVRIDDIGVVFTATVTRVVSDVDTAVDLSSSTLVQLEFEKPDGTRLDLKTATIVNSPGTDGIVTWKNTTPSIFDTVGRWKVRGIATFTNGDLFHGSWRGFHVAE